MHLTKSHLKQIIKEELKIILEQRSRRDLPMAEPLISVEYPDLKDELKDIKKLQPLNKEDEQYYSDSIASAHEDEAVENAVNAVYERIGWALKCVNLPASAVAEKQPESKPPPPERAPNPNAGLSPWNSSLLAAGGCTHGSHVWPNGDRMKSPNGVTYLCKKGEWHALEKAIGKLKNIEKAIGKVKYIEEQRSGGRPKLDYCGKTYKKDVQLILSFLPTRLFPKFISIFNAQKNQLPQLDSAIDNIFGTADVSSGATAADFAHDALMIASALSGDASSSRRKKTGQGGKPFTSKLDMSSIAPNAPWRAKRRARMQAQSLKTLSRAKKESVKLIKQQCERDGPGSFACYEKWNIETNIKRGRDPFADERHWKKRWKRAKARK